MIIDLAETKVAFNIRMSDIREQLKHVANDPNLTIVSTMWWGPICTPDNWKLCSPGSPRDLENRKRNEA